MALDTEDHTNHIRVSDDPKDDLFVAHWWSEKNILDLLDMDPFRSFYDYDPQKREIKMI